MALRFKKNGDSDFPKWEEKKLGDVCDIKNGEQINRWNLLKNKNTTHKYKFINGGVEPSGYYHSFNTFANTITISEGGDSAGFVNLMEEDFWSGGHCYTLINLNSNIDFQYLFQFLKYVEKDIMSKKVGTGIQNLQKKDVNVILIDTPSFEEQQKIATLLSNLDNLTHKIGDELDTLKELKKSIMQQLFP